MRINYWDYCNTEFEYRDHKLTRILFIICIPATCFILSPILLLYILICHCFTIEVPNNYKIFKGEPYERI